MKTLKNFISQHRWFIFFLFAFSSLFLLKNKIQIANSWNDFYFHPDAPFWYFFRALSIFMLVYFIKRRIESRYSPKATPGKFLGYFGIGLLCFMLLKLVDGLLISWIFGNLERNYGSSYLLIQSQVSNSIDYLIFGGFSLAYLYYKDTRSYLSKVNAYQISDAKSKIQQLRNQLDPHFLFNNLNVLDQLIWDDQERATNYLHKFSEVYRFSLINAQQELIGIQDELQFAKNYFSLMSEKYQGGYSLTIDEQLASSSQLVLPPFCLQVLIENAIVHNHGKPAHPVHIHLGIHNEYLVVQNNREALARKKTSNGMALNNLCSQFDLLAHKSVLINETEKNFIVQLPLISTTHV